MNNENFNFVNPEQKKDIICIAYGISKLTVAFQIRTKIDPRKDSSLYVPLVLNVNKVFTKSISEGNTKDQSIEIAFRIDIVTLNFLPEEIQNAIDSCKKYLIDGILWDKINLPNL